MPKWVEHKGKKFVSVKALANHLAKEQRKLLRLNDGTTMVRDVEPSFGKKGEVFEPKRKKVFVRRFNEHR